MIALVVVLILVAVIPLILIARRERRSAGVAWSGAWREEGKATAGGCVNLPPEVGRRLPPTNLW